MKKILGIVLLIAFIFSLANIPTKAQARGGAYYKSASSGRFTTKSSYRSTPTTVYRSYRK